MIKLLREDLKIIKEAEEITNEKYKINEEYYISDDEAIQIIESLNLANKELMEQFEKFVKDVDDNFKRMTIEEQIN